MNPPRLSDAIGRLFDELVRDPWSRPSSRATPHGVEHPLEVEVPIAGGQLGEVSIAREGRRLTIRASIRSAAGERRPGDEEQSIERAVTLPADTEVRGMEARFEGNVLRVRISLRARQGA